MVASTFAVVKRPHLLARGSPSIGARHSGGGGSVRPALIDVLTQRPVPPVPRGLPVCRRRPSLKAASTKTIDSMIE